MTDKEPKLFQDFESVSNADWIAKIEKDLKGKPLNMLNYNPELGIETKAYFHPDNNIQPNQLEPLESNDWYIQENFGSNDNQKIIDSLQVGCDSIQLDVDDKTNYKNLLTGVELKYISTEFRYKDKANWNNLNTFLSNNKSQDVSVSFPVLTNGIENGNWTNKLSDLKDYKKSLDNYAQRTIHVDGFTFGKAGASTIQEIAISLAQLSEYTQYLLENGEDLEDIAHCFYTTLSVNDDYFTNIAKFRAYQVLLSEFFKSFDEFFELDLTLINGQTNFRHMTKNDRYNNLLRSTTQAMSAILGGCANLLVTPFDKSNEVSVRMARNIQLVIKEEAYFDKVNDPSAGAYYIEDLTNQLINKSWDLFLKIEENGGYIKSIENNYIQTEIQKNKSLLIDQLNSSKKTFLGINKYQNTQEDWIDVEKTKTTSGRFHSLTPFILENYYTKSTEK